jgi:hypothetical protein
VNDGNIHLQLVGSSLGDFAALSSPSLTATIGNVTCGPLARISTSVAACTAAPQPDAMNNQAPVQVGRCGLRFCICFVHYDYITLYFLPFSNLFLFIQSFDFLPSAKPSSLVRRLATSASSR